MTKLYLHNALNDLSGTFPSGEQASVTPTWGAGDATTLRKMDRTIGANVAFMNATTVATMAAQDGLLGMWVSPPLSGAQTVGGGTMTLNTADFEFSLDANFWVNSLNIYVWRPSTGTKVGTVRDAAGTSLGGVEGGSNYYVTHITGITTSAVSAADGDVIVCEVWSRHTQSAAIASAVQMIFDGTVENTTENDINTNHASFIELAETLTFQELIVLSRTDTLAPSVSEGVALLSGVVSADTLTPSVVDASALLALIDRADTLTPSVAEASTLLLILAPTDALIPTLVEASTPVVVLAPSDSATPAVDEAAQIINAPTGTDLITPSLTEARSFLGLAALADILTPSLADSGVVQISVVGTDTLTPLLLDMQSLLKILLDPRTAVLLRSRFFGNVHVGVADQQVAVGLSAVTVRTGNAPITVAKRD